LPQNSKGNIIAFLSEIELFITFSVSDSI
jgi:hypothetical protein